MLKVDHRSSSREKELCDDGVRKKHSFKINYQLYLFIYLCLIELPILFTWRIQPTRKICFCCTRSVSTFKSIKFQLCSIGLCFRVFQEACAFCWVPSLAACNYFFSPPKIQLQINYAWTEAYLALHAKFSIQRKIIQLGHRLLP